MACLSKKIDELRIFDEEIHALIEKWMPLVLQDSINHNIPNVWQASVMFIMRSNFLKEAIFELSENEDIYSAGILFRSLIEHSVKFQYIFLRWAQEKNDTVGEEYYKFCDLAEDVSYIDSLKYAAKLIDQESISKNPFDILQEIKQEASKHSLKEIQKKSSQFNYRKISEYIVSKVPQNIVSNFIWKIIPEYSELSSLVHGGPFSERMLYKAFEEDKRVESLSRIASLAFLISCDIKLNAFIIFLNMNRKFEQCYIEIRKILNKYQEQT